ncbi:ATP-binding protein [Defluviimonas sp. WL0024]|uniref:histidine kinase n=2 Tax=Albidovulum TaxID=205889 RepID=A0ABT3J3S2_9RHOB|nr:MULTISPECIES: ATP-binding protein [Defluviimonas]MCU9848626.1 ATP-binding protein [Defluviimonas sp. WL0024]MCW3782306.1 ATP-binding protein [Defluviimonas salinarum]
MRFDWFKSILPRGLYGRAALILVLPIVIIQIVVSIAFIQRHFERVTAQMTRNVVLEISYLAERADTAGDAATARSELRRLAEALAMTVDLPAATDAPSADARVFYDLSGRVVIRTLRALVERVDAVDVSDLRTVRLVMSTRHGPMAIRFERSRVAATNPHQLLVLMLATGLLMTLIAFIFLRNQLRPIRRLARAAEAFGKGRIEPYRPSGAIEVRSAGNAFLDMRARIERQIEQRTLLLSGVSHDLRTPLTRLKLGLSMLGDDPEATAMSRDVDDMQRLLDAFLAFVRGDAMEEEAKVLDPLPLVTAVIEDARRAGQDVVLYAVTGAGAAPMRAGAVRRALENLIGNAVRYGRRAEVSLAILDRAIRITVEDDGPGIARERREEALRPFTRLDDARNQDRGTGVGLGLAITADIARSHGGTLRLGESERLGGLKAELVLAR